MGAMEIFKGILDTVGTLGSATGTILNPILQANTAKENRDFEKQQNEITRQREDTAHVREVADLQKAGLSPLANMSGAQTSTPIAENQEAPQLDMSGLNDLIAVYTQANTEKEKLEEQKRQHNENLKHEEEILEEQKRQFEENLQLTKDITNAEFKNQMEQFLIQEERLNDQIEFTNQKNNREEHIKLSEQSRIFYKEACAEWGFTFKQEITTDYTEYLSAKKQYDKELNDFIDWFKKSWLKNFKDPKNSNSWNFGGGAGLNLGQGYATSKTLSDYFRKNNEYYTKEYDKGYNAYNENIGANYNIDFGNAWNKTPQWERQATMRKYISDYCKKNKIDEKDFLKCPIYEIDHNKTYEYKPTTRQKYEPHYIK